MKLPRICDLISDMEVRYRHSGLGKVDPVDGEYELVMIHKDLLKNIDNNHKILDVRYDDISWFAGNAKELIRDIYANIILLDAHYSTVVQAQIDEGGYDYLFKNHWVHEIQGDEEE
jgi:hypothetical protein